MTYSSRRASRALAVLVGAVAALVVVPVVARASAAGGGQPDSSFGQAGVATPNFGDAGSGDALAVQSDGKVIAAGTADSSTPASGSNGSLTPSGQISVARLNVNGTPDQSFGSSGVAKAPVRGIVDDIALAPDGGILVLGTAFPSTVGPQPQAVPALLMRFTSTGSLDTSFGTGGVVTIISGIEADGVALAADPAGRIYAEVATYSQFSSVAPRGEVYRFSAGGQPDDSYGNSGSGYEILDDFEPTAMMLEASGKALVGGLAVGGNIPTGAGFYFELTTSGTEDPSYPAPPSTLGRPVPAPSGRVAPIDFVTAASGTVYALLSSAGPSYSVIQLLPAGAGFSPTNRVELSLSLLDLNLSSLMVTGDGDIVVSGSDDEGLVVARFLPDGRPEAGFGSDGIAAVAWPDGGPGLVADSPHGLAASADGDYLVVGTDLPGTHSATVAAIGAGAAPSGTQPNSVSRISGSDRIATAVAASQAQFPTSPVGGSSDYLASDGVPYAGAVVLASATNYPDALVGVPLAVAQGGPLLLTDAGALDPRVSAEIDRVLGGGSSKGEVDILGGASAISAAVAQQLSKEGYKVTRYGGSDRYQTALQVAAALGDPPDILLASGLGFADATVAGAAAAHVGGAVLLTSGSQLPDADQQYLSAHPVDAVFAIGGPAAESDKYAIGVAGSDRYETSVDVASRFFPSPSSVGVATGMDYPDALAGGAYMGEVGGPMLLVEPSALPPSVDSWLKGVAPWAASATVFGGTSAVDQSVAAALSQAIT